MTIDVNRVLEAQQTIEEAKKELMLFVKQYFEDETPREAICTENSRVNQECYTEIEVKIKIEELSLNLRFCKLGKAWEYSIACDELGIQSFYPPHDNELTIQGTISVKLKEFLNMRIGGENTPATIIYTKPMRMRSYSN